MKVVLFVFIVFTWNNVYFSQNRQGINLRYSYFDVFDVENTGGNQYVDLNYFKSINKHQFSVGLATALPHRYKFGTVIGINLVHKYSFLTLKKRFSIISCLDVNFYYHKYYFDTKSFFFYNNQIFENTQVHIQKKIIYNIGTGLGLRYVFSERIQIESGYEQRFSLLNNRVEKDLDLITFPSYFLTINIALK